MGRTPNIPAQLKRSPFTLREAREAGLTLDALKGRSWRRVGSQIYCWTGLGEEPLRLLRAWERRLPDAVFAGATSAWLHDLDLEPVRPVEVIVSASSGVRSRRGLEVRRCDLDSKEIVRVRGLRATSVQRTLRDLCRRLPEIESLAAMDNALRLGLVDRSVLGRVDARLGMLAEPAESPMETRLRWLLLMAGLPRPEVQVDLRDSDGRFIGRADLYYPGARLVIEYDGANHRDRLVEDNRRQNLLLNAGLRLLRFSGADVHQRADTVAMQVRAALLASKPSFG